MYIHLIYRVQVCVAKISVIVKFFRTEKTDTFAIQDYNRRERRKNNEKAVTASFSNYKK